MSPPEPGLDLPRKAGELSEAKRSIAWARRIAGSAKIEAEAVRLVETSGRTQREIAEDPRSAFRRCGDGSTSAGSVIWNVASERQEEMAAESKRLRRGERDLRQERDILKRAATFSREGSR